MRPLLLYRSAPLRRARRASRRPRYGIAPAPPAAGFFPALGAGVCSCGHPTRHPAGGIPRACPPPPGGSPPRPGHTARRGPPPPAPRRPGHTAARGPARGIPRPAAARRGVPGKGGSNPYRCITGDRRPISHKFPTKSGGGVYGEFEGQI